MTNPLLEEWQTPFGLPPFDIVKDEDFSPAVDAALAEARAAIAAITGNADEPTFANTIEALEMVDEHLSAILGAF
jgi:peptidyl-dipeptidase Dcp